MNHTNATPLAVKPGEPGEALAIMLSALIVVSPVLMAAVCMRERPGTRPSGTALGTMTTTDSG